MSTVEKTCFVAMPMSKKTEGYLEGHWDRVYNEILKPACEDAGFVVEYAGSYQGTSLIMSDVLKRLHRADMVLCDLSALRPNVMFELGLRQAFDQPVVMVHDERTERPFDLAGLRDVPYDSSLRIDLVREARKNISAAVVETFEKRESGGFSLVRSLGIVKAPEPPPLEISPVDQAIMHQLELLEREIRALTRKLPGARAAFMRTLDDEAQSGELATAIGSSSAAAVPMPTAAISASSGILGQ